MAPNSGFINKQNGKMENAALRLHQHGVANQANGQAFDFKGLAGLYHDGLKIRVFRMELDQVFVAFEPFDGNLFP